MSLILDILESLVACDTQNPPRTIAPSHPIFDVIKQHLPNDFQYETMDFGDGRVNLLAQRGQPSLLFNVHLDTVPSGDGWSVSPLELTRQHDRVFGRGVCDIKGAAACLIATASRNDSDVAILFSTDEEGSNSCCIDRFCQSEFAKPFDQVVVAEPTECQAVIGHRGYLSVTMSFSGQAAHTSQHQLLQNSANHQAAAWMAGAMRDARQFEEETLAGRATCFNIGRIDGGIKNNMIAERCTVTWSARLPGGYANQTLLDFLAVTDGTVAVTNGGDSTSENAKPSKVTFDGASFPRCLEDRDRAKAWCKVNEIPIHEDVDFWTEAAIFSSNGKPTIVLGPGHIAQAHTPDEWVSVAQLETCTKLYRQLMESNSAK